MVVVSHRLFDAVALRSSRCWAFDGSCSSISHTCPNLSADGPGAAVAFLAIAAEVVDFRRRVSWARRRCLQWFLGHQGVDERPSSEGHLMGLLAVGNSRRSCAPGRQCFGWLRSACLVFERHPGSHSERPIWHSPPCGVGVIGTASSASPGSVMTSVVIGSQPGVFVGIPRTQVLRSR